MGDDIGSYKALEEAYKQGKCKAIGLSNFNERQFLEIYNKFQTKPTVNQIETHLYFNQKKMNNFLKKYNCVHESWSPFGGEGAKMLKNKTLRRVKKRLTWNGVARLSSSTPLWVVLLTHASCLLS